MENHRQLVRILLLCTYLRAQSQQFLNGCDYQEAYSKVLCLYVRFSVYEDIPILPQFAQNNYGLELRSYYIRNKLHSAIHDEVEEFP